MNNKMKALKNDSYLDSDTLTMPDFDNSYIIKLLNLEGKGIDKIEVTNKDNELHIKVRLAATIQTCPICGFETSKIHGYKQKKITHSVITGLNCYIDYEARRHKCPCCHKTFYENNPFTFDGMKISLMTVYNALSDLKKPNETFASVAERYHISPTTLCSIFDDFVDIKRKKLPKYLCIDEVYAFRSENSDYVCVLLDFLTQEIVDIIPSRKKYELVNYFDKIKLEERKKVEIVSIDMWKTYEVVAKRLFPNALIAVDKFHLIQELNKRITRIRINVMNKIQVPKECNINNLSVEKKAEMLLRKKQYYLLKKFNWLLTYDNTYNLDPNRKRKYNSVLGNYNNLDDLLTKLLAIDDDLYEAHELYFRLKSFYENNNYETAKIEINSLIHSFRESNVPSLIQFSNTIINWKYPIINSFIEVDQSKSKINEKSKRKYTYINRKKGDGKKLITSYRTINNGVIENVNKTIKQIKRNSNGYSNWHRFRNRILYVINKDTKHLLYPKKAEFRI